MSRFRYLIERGLPEQVPVEVDGRVELRSADLYLVEVTPTDPDGSRPVGPYASVEDVQALATRSAASFMDVEETPLRWKDAPAAWQPDALLVSQYLDDGVKEARDD